jgi:drug/metabolite transporter (DMT)-like permease
VGDPGGEDMGAVPEVAGTSTSEVGTRLPRTANGLSAGAFAAYDWFLLATVGLIFGASFFFIEIALASLHPTVITLTRLILGASTLALFPRARTTRVRREDHTRIVLVGLIWMGIPLMLFPIAQLSIESSVAGMINGSMPIMTVFWTTVLARTLPGRLQALGLTLGFLGILAISLPELRIGDLGSPGSPLGVVLAFTAASLYGLSATLITPLQQRYGSLAVLMRAQLVGVAFVLPFALIFGVAGSTFTATTVLAVLTLGVLGTGLAFVALATLIGRVGAPRGAVSVYLVPVVSITLGITLLSEQVHPLAFVGTGLVLLGAWLTSRRERVA